MVSNLYRCCSSLQRAGRRRFGLLACTVWAAALADPVFAQAYPTKPIRLIVPLAAGSTADIVSRYAGQELGK